MRNSSTPTTSEAGTEASPQGEASHRKQWIGAQQARVGRAGTAAARVRRLRALAVLAATGGTLAVWAVARLLGVDVTVQLGGPGTAQPVDPAVVVIVSVLAGLAGWGVLAGLE